MIKATQHKANRLIERYGIEKALEVVITEIDALSKESTNRNYWLKVKGLILKEKNASPDPTITMSVEKIAFHACEVSTEVCVPCMHKELDINIRSNERDGILMQLQSELKDTLFIRPYSIEKIERAALKLCDAIIELNEH